MEWFTIIWWKYLFDFSLNGSLTLKEKFNMIVCRAKGHPSGPVYYTGPTATEPDYTCKDCGDEL